MKYRILMCTIVAGELFSALLGVHLCAGAEFVNSVGMRMIRIEPGSFTMGADSTPAPDKIPTMQRGLSQYKPSELTPGAGWQGYRAGLFGVLYTGDMTGPQKQDRLEEINFDSTADWAAGGLRSGRWRGFLKAPQTGLVTFTANEKSGIGLTVAGRLIVDTTNGNTQIGGQVPMTEGHMVHVVLEYSPQTPGWSAQRAASLVWNWVNHRGGVPIPPEVLWHTAAEYNATIPELERTKTARQGLEPSSILTDKSNRTIPYELTKNLSYPKHEDLLKAFPKGDPDRFVITTDHVRNGDFDEHPAHRVTITRPFYMAACELTNAQYERFDPSHRRLRGKNGFSKADDEAVVFVSWHDAVAFCDWLSEKEGRPYRLPTEAEWEYACRAGTETLFSTGDSLPQTFHKNARRTTFTQPRDIVPLTVARTPANAWGLFDMHGNVEEWCLDWYGPYIPGDQLDPVGYHDGNFKVTRGGSHGTNLYYLRSANRMATLPENKHWLIGLRVVTGETPKTKPLPAPPPQSHRLNVLQSIPPDVANGPDPEIPYFKGPRPYVIIPKGSNGPVFSHHNHDPAVVQCPNGDLLAIWYTCVEERGRELAVAASRRKYRTDSWQQASLFWDTPDRNDHCPALWNDGRGTIYHFNGLGVAGKWSPLAIIMRTSNDSGANWSKARLIAPEHAFRNMVGEPVFRMKNGAIVFGADTDVPVYRRGRARILGCSTIWYSRDDGLTWTEPGGNISGIHAGIVELEDGRLMALGRSRENYNGWMPRSISDDMGKTWNYSASPFPPISGGQRAVLLRLKQGPLFFASFAADINNPEPVPDGIVPPRYKSKLFAALSFDDGWTWPVRQIVTDCKPDHKALTIDGAPILMNASNAEPQGYLSVCQSVDGLVHLISSVNHYEFNLAWLKQTPPELLQPAAARILPVRTELPYVYNASQLPSKAKPPWHSNIAIRDEPHPPALEQLPGGLIKIKPLRAAKVQPHWSNERASRFHEADAQKGFAAEVAVQVAKSSGEHGFELAVFARGGTLTVNQYRVSITRTGVYYWYDKKFIKIAEGLDNFSGVHAYRLAVRDDTVAQIYRDGRFLGIGLVDLRIDWAPPARGSYITWGLATQKAEAAIDYIAYDTTGPSQPR